MPYGSFLFAEGIMRCFSLLLCFAVMFAAIFSFCSCSTAEQNALEAVSQIIEKTKGLPAGVIYRREAKAGEDGYFSEAVMRSMYGEGSQAVFDLAEDFAIYTSSFAKPYEIAVIVCYSRSDTDTAAKMFIKRQELLRVAFRTGENRSLVDSASIEISGRTVIMKITGEK